MTVRIFGFLDLHPEENMQIKHFGLDQNESKGSFPFLAKESKNQKVDGTLEDFLCNLKKPPHCF